MEKEKDLEKEDFFDKAEKWLGIMAGVCFILAVASLAALIVTIVVAVLFYGVDYLVDYMGGMFDVFS